MCVPCKKKKRARKQPSGTESRQPSVEIEDRSPVNDEADLPISQVKHGNSEARCSASEEPTRLKIKAFHRDADDTQKIWHDDLAVTAAAGQSYDGTSDGQPIDVAP